MNPANAVELEAKDVRFYSEGDEAAFFEWLDKIPCVSNYRGEGRVLLISVDRGRADEDSLRELLAIFFRYRIAMRQLSIFDSEAVAEWFRSPASYWFDAVFGVVTPQL